jgi:DNA mismatch repair protein MutS
MKEDFTPMLRQYRQLKALYPDAILLFRLGDFYEMFDEDAKIASRELELVLTSRRFSKTVKLPMCGVPYHQLTTYIGKLIEKGYKIAIAEQMEEPGKGKRLVKREIVRVITPGTVIEEGLLPDKEENFLAAIVREDGSYGLAVMELSTGDFSATQVEGANALDSLLEELERLRPSEYVLPTSLASDESFTSRLTGIRKARLSPQEDQTFSSLSAKEALLSHLPSIPKELETLPLALRAAGALLCYLKENQLSDLEHIRAIRVYNLSAYMNLDAVTCRNLELLKTLREGETRGSLFWVLDHTCTAMGARLLKRWITRPLLDPEAIKARLEAVENLVQDHFLRSDLRNLLDGLYDVERLVGRIGFGSANARDLVGLRRSLERIPPIKEVLGRAQAQLLRELNQALDPLQDVANLIRSALVDNPPILVREGGLIRPGYSKELDSLRREVASGKAWLAEYEAKERERTGIKNLRIRYNEVFGFFIEVTRSYLHLVPPNYERKATISGAERFITPELKAKESEILAAQDKAKELEYELFVRLRREVASRMERLQQAGRILAQLDVLCSLAEAAARYGYTKPIVDESTTISIKEGRHPVVERMMPEGEPFVPNDAFLEGDGDRLLVITGPNMSGKSVYVRQVALIALMAQMGSFVPAKEARIGLVDKIFTRIGATDEIARGRSTFLVEMEETAHILRNATPRSLIILDEVGRGTSTYDGMSIAWAVAEYIHNRIGARTLFATHYHELTELEEHLEGAKNYSLAVAEEGGKIIFLRRVIRGGAEKSYGVQVAKLAGLPEEVTERAKEILEKAEKGYAPQPLTLREVTPKPESLLLPAKDQAIWEVVREIFRVDIANITPVQALILLNELQRKLKGDYR